jgi:hypothetical protein
MMAASGPGASYTSHHTASIIDVLLAYGSRGGTIYAAYRHPDNPLLLTHVRWQSPTGETLEASRSPDDMAMVREEREAWAQVALRSTTLRPDSVGPQAPWLQAPIDPREAYDLAMRARRAREASVPPQHSMGGSSIPSHGVSFRPAPLSPNFPQRSPHGLSSEGNPSYEDFSGPSAAIPSIPEGSQVTGSWSRADFPPHAAPVSQPSHEITVIACIEIEMPSLVTEASRDFTRDFARDVALNFNRAARAIPQTRETRGWMHGARMTLGALMVLGPGSRPATRAEMELAADTLASALAKRTLPYAQMRFADMAEWAQGVPLPE